MPREVTETKIPQITRQKHFPFGTYSLDWKNLPDYCNISGYCKKGYRKFVADDSEVADRSKGAAENKSGGLRQKRDWTQGSIFSNLVALSWPVTVTQTLMSLGPTIDLVWVGKLGDDAVAGVGVASVIVQLAQGVMMGLTMALRALISRAIGGKDSTTAQRFAQHAMLIAIAYAILIAVLGYLFGEKIILLITQDPEIVDFGAIYLKIAFIGSATMTVRMTMDSIMQAAGDSVNPMWIAVVYRVVHIALCPFLVFGWWIFPEMGVAGAAYTGLIAQALGIILGLRVLFSDRSRLRLTFKGFYFDSSLIWRIFRIGIPASVSGIQRNLNQFFLQIFIAPFGAVALAAHTIVMRLEMLIMMPAMSFGMGASVLVGQNLGAKKPERSEKSVWMAVAVVEGFAILVSLIFFVWTGPVIRLFNNDLAMDTLAVQFIHIAVVGWVMMGFSMVLMNCLQGAGDTMPTMLIAIITAWVVTIPLAYFLPRYTDWGVISIRWAISASSVIYAIANVIYFRTGRWRTRRV
jgi:putative MATE family efflux protein